MSLSLMIRASSASSKPRLRRLLLGVQRGRPWPGSGRSAPRARPSPAIAPDLVSDVVALVGHLGELQTADAGRRNWALAALTSAESTTASTSPCWTFWPRSARTSRRKPADARAISA